MKTLLVGALAASMLVAGVVTAASLSQTPTYEASAMVMVGPKEQSGMGRYTPSPTPSRPKDSGSSPRR